jgi:aconitate hydratase
MGVLPLQFLSGQSVDALGLTGGELYDVLLPPAGLQPGGELGVRASAPGTPSVEFAARVRIDTPIELEYYRHGGVLHMVLRNLLQQPPAGAP